jgi:hypothetical protein
LNELGGSQLMTETVDWVCRHDKGWAETLDKRWQGIGDWIS